MSPPTFLCIDARAVRQHREVSPGKKKELHFFNHRDAYERGPDWYESQFRSGPRIRAIRRLARALPRGAVPVPGYEDDIAPDPAKQPTLDRVFAHIGVQPGFEPCNVTEARNVRSSDFEIRMRHASPWRRGVLTRLPERTRDWPLWRIEVSASDRRAIADEFRPEVQRLEQMLGRAMPWRLGRVA